MKWRDRDYIKMRLKENLMHKRLSYSGFPIIRKKKGDFEVKWRDRDYYKNETERKSDGNNCRVETNISLEGNGV